MVNYLAVLVAAIAAFAVGALWYGPIFGKQWRHLMGYAEGQMGSGKLTPVQAMGGGFIATLVLTYVLAYLLLALGAFEVNDALVIGFWIWLGFVATTMASSVLYEGRPLKLYFINVVHYLVAISVAAAVLSWWSW